MMCATLDCNANTTGKSKYCRPCAKIAREKWLARINDAAEARQVRSETFATVWQAACNAAKAAHEAAKPTPMVVTEVDPITNEPRQRFFVSEGCCGYASVKVMPANAPFANWLKAHANARKSYRGGVCSPSFSYGSQSYERSCAAADAAVRVIKQALPDVQVYVDSWVD